jgi:hypothetical protein
VFENTSCGSSPSLPSSSSAAATAPNFVFSGSMYRDVLGCTDMQVNVGPFSIGNLNKSGNGAAQIQQGVHGHRPGLQNFVPVFPSNLVVPSVVNELDL